MKNSAFPVLALLLSLGCTSHEEQVPGQAGWMAIPNAYAKHFQLQLRDSDRRLLVFGNDVNKDTIGIYRWTSTATGKEVAVEFPMKRVALVSTTHLPFFEALQATDVVVGLAHADQVRDARVRERVRTGGIQEITRADGLDRERLIALTPQAVFDYPFGRGGQEQNLFHTTIAVTEYLEEHPLGRAEWIRFFGILLDRQEMADSLFRAIVHRYEVARDMNQHLGKAPHVLFGSQWEQRWWMPPGNSYMATLINDASGHYWFTDSIAEGNIEVPLEQVLDIGRECQFFGLIMAAQGKVDGSRSVGGDERLSALDAVRKGGFIGNTARNDLFGKALLEPEVVLKDLRCIFHPGSCGDHQPSYFFPIDQ